MSRRSVTIPDDFRLDSYTYKLPEERIAQRPCPERDASRLLVLRRGTGTVELARFRDIGQYLAKGSLLVANDSRVFPARLLGRRPGKGKAEVLLLTPPPFVTAALDASGLRTAEAEVLLRPAGKIRLHDRLELGPDLAAVVLAKGEFGRSRVALTWRGDLATLIEAIGSMPLPPYIRRAPDALDRERYQTVFADQRHTGSAAAPTAGLHFTPALIEALAESGIGFARLTLHVGYGTFSPVRCQDIRGHAMHTEWFEVPQATARAISRAKAEKRPVVAVGTTTARALEGLAREAGEITAQRGATDIFIHPGFEFRVVDQLITNFHLPGSSLLIMVSALAGRGAVLSAYATALREGFRFFSYGDAMLIVP